MFTWKSLRLLIVACPMLSSCSAQQSDPVVTVHQKPTAKKVTLLRLTPMRQLLSAQPTPQPTRKVAVKSTPKPQAKRAVVSGKSEGERRKLFADMVALEDKANADAEAVYSPYTEVTKYLDESDRLTKKYKATYRRQHKLSEKEANLIGVEGVENAWPPLKPRP